MITKTLNLKVNGDNVNAVDIDVNDIDDDIVVDDVFDDNDELISITMIAYPRQGLASWIPLLAILWTMTLLLLFVMLVPSMVHFFLKCLHDTILQWQHHHNTFFQS